MSSSEASSSDSEGSQTSQIQEKTKRKAPAVVVTPHGKNEGENPDWAYKPPPGAVLASPSEDADEFDWEALQDNEDIELWIMRVPEGIKPKHLEGLKLDAPSGSTSVSARMGSIDRKSTTYDVWSLGDDAESAAGAEEVKTLTYLAPRHKKRGKLYAATKVPTRHLVISARPTEPSLKPPTDEGEDMSWARQQNPPRPSYPKEMLKHAFVPFGSTVNTEAEESMALDKPPSAAPPVKTKAKKDDEIKTKKRKVESDKSARKSKKSHAAST
ncbi:hypothetical protein BDW22DRAFT_1325995 [Trametopsis cervina]|nr:hypothetical protein BDW22DRAFT_1325995 [Trametopsis cervina]